VQSQKIPFQPSTKPDHQAVSCPVKTFKFSAAIVWERFCHQLFKGGKMKKSTQIKLESEML
jgi:hypothetical protein